MHAEGISIHKRYTVESEVVQYLAQGTQESKADIKIQFRTGKSNHLEVPLPAGKVRVHKADEDGALQLIGEDRIFHTPIDSEVELKIGRAFDITAKRTQSGYRRLGDRAAEVSYNITVTNHKHEDIEVLVKEHLRGDWVITDENRKGERIDSTTQAYALKLAEGADSTITYTARFSY